MKSQMSIFLVEDEALSAFYMTLQLQKMGFHVHTTLSRGEEAVVCALRDRPDLILMDINLAGEMNGIEAIKRIKARLDIPVIFITGYSDAAIMGQAKALDPVAYLVKPIDKRELEMKIKSVIAEYATA
jgi:CheY-like chemotaxis protein